MFTVRRGALAPWLLPLALHLAACGGPGEAVRGCSTDLECGPGALCIQSACVANRPPVVTLQLPSVLTTNRVLYFEATATDPDPGDTISSLSWTITPVGAACDAEPEPTIGPRLELVFWCGGTYEVAVVATDRRDGQSVPARQVIDVSVATGAPQVTAGQAQQVDHACGGTPFACRPATAGSPVSLALSATVDDPAGGPYVSRWRAIPPPGADPALVVTWARGQASLSTEAWVETPGGPIAGTWRFRMRVTSAAGLLGQADQLVEIGNRPPVWGVQSFPLDHRYEGGAYLASGTLALPVTDPDGDPISLTVALEESGTDGCSSRLGPVTAGSLTYDTRCSDATRLIGLASRTLRVLAADGNGASAEASLPIVIGNRPPEVRLASNPAGGQVTVDHSVGPCPAGSGSCFLAAGTATFQVVDPDGDPVTSPAVAATVPSWLVSSTGGATTAFGVTSFRFASALSAPGEFRAPDGRSPFTLVATSADPFGASSSLTVPIVIGNHPPVLKSGGGPISVTHRYDRALQSYVASAPLGLFEDPDGDPLGTDGSVADGPCASFSILAGEGRVECVLPYTPGPGLPTLGRLAGDHLVVLRAFDGWEGTTAPTLVGVQDSAPSATSFDGVVDSCTCACAWVSNDSPECLSWRWKTNYAQVQLPFTAADADGDPLQVTVGGSPPQTYFPPVIGPVVSNPTIPLSLPITVDDGAVRVQVTLRVTGFTCSTAGQDCTP